MLMNYSSKLVESVELVELGKDLANGFPQRDSFL